MKRSWNRGIGLIVAVWGLTDPGGVVGQMSPMPPRPQSPAVPPAAIMMNPYLNPYMNPYFNPAATQQPMSAGTAALYLYSAQAASGGIGSGRLSGSRPQASSARPAEMPDSASVPGAGASRYFNPGPVNVNGAGRYYNRRSRYFQSNGR